MILLISKLEEKLKLNKIMKKDVHSLEGMFGVLIMYYMAEKIINIQQVRKIKKMK